ncbi:DoxX family protein [Micromonospora sp. AMSO1212t]|uniref:Oxidoreductase n=1 Tax=Micromonospora tulbaghiae TaxID=479978 RepID=A0ABY0KRK7_9ACTN|nr:MULTISPECIES: DoxX family protein [Micromonospora]KAB1902445.1 DoxX family protein [Micromonospora sp. AMSO1212t]MDX5458442.1 DoxX family protein [Micromonospora tulbaghiae]SCF03791.1 putative oxidoreductase [Micromonospora tulbaghiae]
MIPAQLKAPVLSLFRIVTGVLFLCHGAASIFGVFGGNPATGGAVPFATWPGWWAALIQLVCGALVLLGLFTRPAALLASGSMAYAYFVVHQPDHLMPMQNGGELAALFCWSFLLVAVLGPGNWALDALLARRRSTATEPAAAPATVPV